jgi:hypothetical protein
MPSNVEVPLTPGGGQGTGSGKTQREQESPTLNPAGPKGNSTQLVPSGGVGPQTEEGGANIKVAIQDVGDLFNVPTGMPVTAFKMFYQEFEGTLKIPALPSNAGGVRELLVKFATAVGVFSKAPDILKWVNHFKDLSVPDEEFDEVPTKWGFLDRHLRAAFGVAWEHAKKDPNLEGLHGEVMNAGMVTVSNGKDFPGARMVRMLLRHFQAYSGTDMLYDPTDLQRLHWNGGNDTAHQFLNDWDAVLVDLRDPSSVPETIKHNV